MARQVETEKTKYLSGVPCRLCGSVYPSVEELDRAGKEIEANTKAMNFLLDFYNEHKNCLKHCLIHPDHKPNCCSECLVDAMVSARIRYSVKP